MNPRFGMAFGALMQAFAAGGAWSLLLRDPSQPRWAWGIVALFCVSAIGSIYVATKQ